MREIKFRAWCGDLGRMVYQDEDVHFWLGQGGYWSVNANSPEEILADTLESNPSPLLMQYTGLKDRNGAEIYEGDVLKDENGAAAAEWAPGMGAWGIKDSDDCMTLLADSSEGMEVIGNIHQDPELLEVK